MSDLRQAAQQALDFIVATNKSSQFWLVPGSNLNKTVTALRAALAAAVAEPVASVTECEACFTPDVCQLRGTCDHYAAERLRVAAPPQRGPLTDEQIDAMYSASYRTRESDYATNWYWYERGIREAERAHGITKEAP